MSNANKHNDYKIEEKVGSDYYYSLINQDIEKTFTHEQRQEVKNCLKRAVRVPSQKIIDFRTTFWFIRKLYLVVFIGLDKRGKMDQRSYDDKLSAIRLGLKSAVYIIQFILLALLLFLAFYFLKSFAGIDLFPESHLF